MGTIEEQETPILLPDDEWRVLWIRELRGIRRELRLLQITLSMLIIALTCAAVLFATTRRAHGQELRALPMLDPLPLAIDVQTFRPFTAAEVHALGSGELESDVVIINILLQISDLDAFVPQPPRYDPTLRGELDLIRILDPRFPLTIRAEDLGRVRDCLRY